MLINEELPLSIGGGIGQSGVSMFLLRARHIGEVRINELPYSLREV
jgi:aspartate--ammonia ligase